MEPTPSTGYSGKTPAGGLSRGQYRQVGRCGQVVPKIPETSADGSTRLTGGTGFRIRLTGKTLRRSVNITANVRTALQVHDIPAMRPAPDYPGKAPAAGLSRAGNWDDHEMASQAPGNRASKPVLPAAEVAARAQTGRRDGLELTLAAGMALRTLSVSRDWIGAQSNHEDVCTGYTFSQAGWWRGRCHNVSPCGSNAPVASLSRDRCGRHRTGCTVSHPHGDSPWTWRGKSPDITSRQTDPPHTDCRDRV